MNSTDPVYIANNEYIDVKVGSTCSLEVLVARELGRWTVW